MRALVVAALLAAPAGASAAPCDPALGEAFTGPIELGLRPARLGAPRTPCREDSVSVRLAGDATIDVPSFYGHLGGGLEIGVRKQLWQLELSVDITAPELRFAQNASFKATETEFGPVAVGVAWGSNSRNPFSGPPISSLIGLRIVVPGSSTLEGDQGGGELAAHVGIRPLRWLTLDTHASYLVWLVENFDASTLAFRQMVLSTGAGLRLSARWVIPVAVEYANGEGFPEYMALRTGVRLRTAHAGHFEVGLVVPYLGDERMDAAAHLSWRLPLGW